MFKPIFARRLRRALLSLGLLLASATADAATVSSWSLRAWQSDEGLPDNAVVGIGRTRDGFLWVATQGGLVRFDGLQFHEFAPMTAAGVPTGLMRNLCVDHRDRLWVAKDLTVLACMDAGRTTALTTRDGLPAGRAKMIVEDGEENLWVAYSASKVVQVRDGQLRSFGPEEGLSGRGDCQLATDRRGQLWYASGDSIGVFRHDRFIPLTKLAGVQSIAGARSGGVWAASEAGLFRYNEGSEIVRVGALPTARAAATANVLYEDKAGALWVGTSDAGLFSFTGSVFQSIKTSHREILCITEGSEGTIWVGTMGGGLNRIRPLIVDLQDVGPGPEFEGLRSVCQDKEGILWAVDRNGKVARDSGEGWRPFSTNEGWTVQNAAAIEACPEGGVWIGTQRNGLHLWRERIITSLGPADGLAGNVIRSLLASPIGDLWIGTTAESLQRLRGGTLQNFKVPAGCGPIRAMALDGSGTLWAGTASGLLLRIRDDVLATETLTSEALPQAIRCLHVAADGTLWIGYSGTGVGRLKDGRFTQFRASQGLHDDYISQILEDNHERLWMAGNRGIFCVRKQELEAVAQGRLAQVQSVVFGREEGLPPLQTSWEFWPGAVRTKDGRLRVAMRTGLAIINSESLEADSQPPQVLIEGVSVDGREVAAYDVNLPAKPHSPPPLVNLRDSAAHLSLPPSHQQVAFSFTAPSFATTRSVAFKYRLESLDNDWVDVGTRRTAYYTHLPPGDYRFRVVACNRDGVWNEDGGFLAITATPFLWETAWFRTAVILLTCGLLTGAVLVAARRRYQQQLARLERKRLLERERTRIAQDLHDDLGAGLVEISFGSELAQDPALPVEEAREHTREIGTRAREMVTALDEIVWAVNPKHDNLASLASYFCQYAQHFLRTTPVKCHLEIAKDLPVAPLNAEERHSLFLAFKEALSNVVQHADAKDLRLAISAEDGTLKIVVSDNGRGLAEDSSGAGNGADGLNNMQERLRQIGGRCEVSSAPGQRTTITFTVPLESAGGPR